MKYYPLVFEPNLHSVVWGGDSLTKWKGLPAIDVPVGESWEVSTLPSSISIIANGEFQGCNLVSVITENAEDILGKHVAMKYENELPLLVKFIDARRDLSIQVHPNDELAHQLHKKRGKTEMWYIVDAKPGAFLYSGFSRSLASSDSDGEDVCREDALEAYRQKVADGTIIEYLAKHEVKAGDVFFLPAGRVHTICGGILLAEVQQSSDITYRIFDYNRLGIDGKPRELHTELAAQALDFHVYDDYRTHYNLQPNGVTNLIDSSCFTVNLADVNGSLRRSLKSLDSFVIAMSIHGDCRIKLQEGNEEILLHEGNSALIPASVADYDLISANKEGSSLILETYVGKK